MFYKKFLGIVAIAAVTFLTGCSSVGMEVVMGLGKAMQGLGAEGMRAVGGIIGGESATDIAGDIVGYRLDAKTKNKMQFEAQKSVSTSPAIQGAGVISGLINGGNKNEKTLKPSEEAFRQLNQNTNNAKKEPESIDLGNGIILTPEDGKAATKAEVNADKGLETQVKKDIIGKTSPAEDELMAEVDAAIKKDEAKTSDK